VVERIKGLNKMPKENQVYSLEDVQGSTDKRGVELQQVGVKEVPMPLCVLQKKRS
jgi:GTP cyclohydrolase FolE2